jgi:phospholipid-transporting ATPase
MSEAQGAKIGSRKPGSFPTDILLHLKGKGEVVADTGRKGDTSFCDNNVISSRYTLYNFVPMNLFEQFCNMQNIYFLFIGGLQCIGVISTTHGVPTMYFPLAFIVGVSMLRSAKDDYE